MPGIGVHDHGKRLEIFERSQPTGVPLMVHPHDQELMEYIEEGVGNAASVTPSPTPRPTPPMTGSSGTPPAPSSSASRRRLGRSCTCSTPSRSAWSSGFRRARDAGQNISAELNPWALFLGNDWRNIERLGSYALSYYVPEKNTQPLWDALADGTIDIISTDHGPHTREEKEPGWTDGWKAHTGTPAAQFYVPMFLGAAPWTARSRWSGWST